MSYKFLNNLTVINSTFSPYNSGGTANDSLKVSSSNLGASFGVQNTNASGYAGIEYIDNSGNVKVFTGFNNGNGQEFRFNNVASGGYIDFLIGGTTGLKLFNNRNVTIGSATDAGYKLDVNGIARVTPNGSAISAFYIQTHGTYVNRTRLVVGATDGANNNSGLQFVAATSTGKTYINGWDDGGTSQYDIVISSNGGRVQFGTDSSSVASSQLTINSTTRGFLPPRMTSAQRTAISTPAVGLIVYQTDSVEGVYVYTSGGWKSLTMV